MGCLLRRLLISSVLVAILAPGLSARFPFRRGSVRQRATNSTQRRRLHADNLITDIGTVEIEWGNSFAQGIYAMPTALKFTPSGGRVELMEDRPADAEQPEHGRDDHVGCLGHVQRRAELAGHVGQG